MIEKSNKKYQGEVKVKRFFQISFILIFFLPFHAWSLDVIPGLKVFGSNTRAAYGNVTNPKICIVNTLNPTSAIQDSTRNGVPVKTGGLKSFIDWNVNNKLIIFEVSGYIVYNGRYTLDNNYVTIAAQTSPSPGITLRNTKLDIRGHDVLIQHLRVRMDDCGTFNEDPYKSGIDCGEAFFTRDGININSYNVSLIIAL